MPVDSEIISFGIALFFLLLIIFFLLLRLSNSTIAKRLRLLLEKQKNSEKLNKKLARTVIENKKDLEKKIQALKKELESIETGHDAEEEVALAKAGRRR